jgi:hypothetical protein
MSIYELLIGCTRRRFWFNRKFRVYIFRGMRAVKEIRGLGLQDPLVSEWDRHFDLLDLRRYWALWYLSWTLRYLVKTLRYRDRILQHRGRRGYNLDRRDRTWSSGPASYVLGGRGLRFPGLVRLFSGSRSVSSLRPRLLSIVNIWKPPLSPSHGHKTKHSHWVGSPGYRPLQPRRSQPSGGSGSHCKWS